MSGGRLWVREGREVTERETAAVLVLLLLWFVGLGFALQVGDATAFAILVSVGIWVMEH